MSVILVLVGASLFVAICFLIAFIWAVRTGQYDDKYTPSVRILFDDEVVNTKNKIDNNLKDNHGIIHKVNSEKTKKLESKNNKINVI